MRRIALHTAVVLSTLVLLLVMWQLREAVLIFVLSLGTAAAIRPLVGYLFRGNMPRGVALAAAYLVMAGIVIGFVVILGASALGELAQLGDDSVRLYDHISEVWPKRSPLQQAIARRLLPPEKLYTSVTEQGITLAQALLGVTMNFFNVLVDVVVVLVLSVYWSIDRVAFERLWLSLLPIDRRVAMRDVWRAIETEAGAYLRSEIIQSLALGFVLFAGYSLCGCRYPALLALCAALLRLIPWVGTPLTLLAVALLSSPLIVFEGTTAMLLTAIPAAIWTLGAMVICEFLVERRLFNRHRYNALLVALCVIALGDLLGIVGLFLGPPLAVAIQILGRNILRQRSLRDARPAPVVARWQAEVASVRKRLGATNDPPIELVNLAQRLGTLVDRAQEICLDTDGEELDGQIGLFG